MAPGRCELDRLLLHLPLFEAIPGKILLTLLA
jgi:hypothetical protein